MELPPWCSDSPALGTYVARACPHDPDPLREPLDAAAQLFKQSTNTFVEWVEHEEPLQLQQLDFSEIGAWHALSGQLARRYRRSHWRLIQNDPDYRDALGAAVDTHDALTGKPRTRPEPASTRATRYTQEGQHLVKKATLEGLATAIASYAVVPRLVTLQESGMSLEAQVTTSQSLLPAAADFGRQLARHSKHGHARLLRHLGGLSEYGHIHYPTLTYRPEVLQITANDRGQPALTVIGKHHEPNDLVERFRGCPALSYGSITRINKFIAQIILKNNCYEQALL